MQKKKEQEKLEKEKKSNGIRDKNYIVRNPLNNIIYDQEEQKRLDMIEYQKKQRFLSKGYVDNYYHSKHNNLETRKLISHQYYFNPFEYKMNNIRGYDILTNKSQTIMEGNKYLTEIQAKKLETNWDKIKNNADSKTNTFKSKKLYLSEYDTNDIDLHYSNYLSKRKPILEQRANTINFIERNNGKKDNNKKSLTKSIDMKGMYNNNVFNKFENLINFRHKGNETIDKDKFFGTPKAILTSI